MPVIRKRWVSRDMLRADPDCLFVFGDNLKRIGLGGQAKEMRGEPNAVGLPTKRSPYEYLSNSDFFDVEAAAKSDIDRLGSHLRSGGTVVWPEAGIGTGLAKLREKAPAVAAFYDGLLAALESQ